MTPIDTAELERHADTERNRIINRCSTDLESIVNGHDPEIHNLNVRVWDRLDRMAVEIEQHFAHRKAEAWQPISSAPKDGTPVMVYVPDFEKITEAWFCEHTGLWPHSAAYSEEGEPCNVGQPTHWRPLPAPPTTPEAEGGEDA